MRTLDRNKTIIWIVNPISRTTIFDNDGFDTGETTVNFGTPIKVNITLYPSSGAIVEKIFGKDASFDLIALSNDVVMTEDSLIFLSEPVSTYDKTYEYKVSSIKKSINTYNYGLRQRT